MPQTYSLRGRFLHQYPLQPRRPLRPCGLAGRPAKRPPRSAGAGLPSLIVQAGRGNGTRSHSECRRALTRALESALPLAEQHGITLLLEPLNIKVDHPGYHLCTSEDAFSYLAQFQSPYLKILYDIYHQQITEGNILQTVSEHISQIGHFHIAAVPGRIEPCSGELNYPCILRRIEQLGYTGWIGLEYMPKRDPVETLRECRSLLP